MAKEIKDIILVVDDDENILNLYIALLSHKYTVYSASNARNMREILHQVTPSIILLDIMMPEEDGFETANNLKYNNLYKEIPIIFVTAKTNVKDLKKGFDCGADDYLRKPFNAIELDVRVRNVLEKKKLQLKLKELSIHDYLTNIFNRRYFLARAIEKIEHLKRLHHQVSFSILDIDYFKNVNDIHGHLTGDFILKEFADILKKSIRPYDILARYGGEEFIILFNDCDKKLSDKILTRIKNKVFKKKFIYNEKTIHLTFSGGISDSSDIDFQSLESQQILEELIRISDERLYKAKNCGRNKILSSN